MTEKIELLPDDEYNFNSFQELFDSCGLDSSYEQIAWILDSPDSIFDNTSEDFLATYKQNLSKENILETIKQNDDITFAQLKEQTFMVYDIFNDLFQNKNLGLPQNRIDFFLRILKIAAEQINLIPDRKTVDVSIELLNNEAIIPTYAHEGDAGADIYSAEDVIFEPGETKLVSTGLKVGIPMGYEIQIRPRSGMSLKTPIRIPNTPGTIDYGYYDEVKIICQNTSQERFAINKGERIAQMVIMPVPMINWIQSKVGNDNTNRQGGFGSSGK